MGIGMIVPTGDELVRAVKNLVLGWVRQRDLPLDQLLSLDMSMVRLLHPRQLGKKGQGEVKN